MITFKVFQVWGIPNGVGSFGDKRTITELHHDRAKLMSPPIPVLTAVSFNVELDARPYVCPVEDFEAWVKRTGARVVDQ